jgi:hypothetical protein
MPRDPAHRLSTLEAIGYQIEFRAHAKAILEADFPEALDELSATLNELTIPIEEIIGSGGGEAKGTQRLRRGLAKRAWNKTKFEIIKTINGAPSESTSHEIDHVRTLDGAGAVALEIEWNNKDPFFDRDLENFKRLHAEGAISAGIIITRGSVLQDEMKELVLRFANDRKISGFPDLETYRVHPTNRQREQVERRTNRARAAVNFRDAWADHFVSDKYGAATTHWSKLQDRVRRGVGNPCPLVLIGLPPTIVTFDEGPKVLAEVLGEDGAAEH